MLIKRAYWLKNDMIDHKKQWQFLEKSAELGKLPHALLFYGQEGLGKKALAIKFSKLLIGQDIEKGIYPDFILIEPEGKEIQIAQIRNVINRLCFKPYLGGYKVAVIDKAHLMTQEAQSCFLKFLEEPKGKTVLILITEYPEMLVKTILSRVQKLRFFPVKGFEIEDDEKLISDLIKISKSDLVSRFQYAKTLSEKNLKETLDTWLRYLRKIFINRLTGQRAEDFNQYSLTKLKDIIRQIQSTKFLIFSTNTNPRLALEILLMEL